MRNLIIILKIGGFYSAIIILPWIYVWWDHRTYVHKARAAWIRRRGRPAIHFEPVAVHYYGYEPRTSYADTPRFGALGLADGKLIFTEGSRFIDYVGVFDAIRWIGYYEITVKSGGKTRQEHALIVHLESTGSDRATWHVVALTFDKWANPGSATLLGLARTLAKQIDQKVHYYPKDYGPAPVTRMSQDVYGAWACNREGELYAAPDRLLFNLRDAIHFAELRRVDVYEKGGLLDKLNPFSEDLLRIEYAVDGDHHTTGFLVRHAEVWAEVLRHRAGVPVEVHAGRKKKPAA